MKKSARVLIGITLMIVIVVIFYTTNVVKNSPKNLSVYDTLMSYDFENNYPDNPSDIIVLNNKIIKYLYSDEITKEQIEDIALLQKNLFSQKLIDLNPENEQLETLKQQIKLLKEDKIKIMDIKDNPPEYDEKTNFICTIKSLIYMTKGGNVYRTYTIIKEQNKFWKIYSWEDSADGFVDVKESSQ